MKLYALVELAMPIEPINDTSATTAIEACLPRVTTEEIQRIAREYRLSSLIVQIAEQMEYSSRRLIERQMQVSSFRRSHSLYQLLKTIPEQSIEVRKNKKIKWISPAIQCWEDMKKWYLEDEEAIDKALEVYLKKRIPRPFDLSCL